MQDLLPPRVCSSCKTEKPASAFYKLHAECRSCVGLLVGNDKVRLTLEEKAAHRKQEKMLRAEMRKLAEKRLEARKKRHKEQARKRVVNKVTQEEVDNAPPVDPAVKELAKRELARRRLIEFIKQFHPRYKAGWVHHDICRRLEQFAKDVDEGKSPRLMILMPPRHGKSQIASKLYPAWHLGHYPHHEFIACSYNISLALEFSREVREVVRSEYYEKLFPKTRINQEFQAAEAWKLQSPTGVGAGGYVAAGIGVGITGKGAHVLVIDDPVKNAEEAENAETRQKHWDWYISSAYSRLAPGGGVLVIQTWWHDDDLAGRLQKAMAEDPEADKFIVVKYPAIAEQDEEFRVKGEALHPERYDLEALERIKRLHHAGRYWSALYQQNPVSDEGAYFTERMFRYRNQEPDVEILDVYQAWDMAISEEQQVNNNWTVGVTIGLDSTDTAHVLERTRIKTNDASVIEDAIIDMYARYRRVHAIGFEDGQIWKTMRSSLKRRMKERKVYIPLTDDNVLKPIREKTVRARPLQARMQNGKVTFPRGKEWVDEMKKEMLRFPVGAQDDQVDAMAWCVQLLLGRAAPAAPKYGRQRVEKTVAEQVRALANRQGLRGSHMAA